MKITVKIDGDLNDMMRAEHLAGERAVTAAMRQAGEAVKLEWRGQVAAALGVRLGNAIRARTYPSGQPSMNASSLVWSKAPKITEAHERGATIRSSTGFWLAIPLPAAGKGARGAKISPGEWERRRGVRLRFVYLNGRRALLVADDARINSRGLGAAKRGKRRADGILRGAQTVPIFVLVPQVKLKKVLDLYPAAERLTAGLPAAIVAQWRQTR